MTAAQIAERTSPAVAALVTWLTNPSKGSKASRAERKKMDREHLAQAPTAVKQIKMLDRTYNLRDLDEQAPVKFVRLYADESQALLDEALTRKSVV